MTTMIEPGRYLVRESRILEVLAISRSTWRRGVKSGRFPKPVKISPRVNVWRESDIVKLMLGGAE